MQLTTTHHHPGDAEILKYHAGDHQRGQHTAEKADQQKKIDRSLQTPLYSISAFEQYLVPLEVQQIVHDEADKQPHAKPFVQCARRKVLSHQQQKQHIHEDVNGDFQDAQRLHTVLPIS